jgi:hypothetical protein
MEAKIIILFIALLSTTAINVANIPETGTPPSIRSHASLVYEARSNSLVIYGGYSTKFHDDTWSFNLSSQTWERQVLATSTSPGARINSFLFTVKSLNNIYLFGGKSERGPIIDMYVFNIQSQTVKLM